ncbi:MAG: site-specific recombinase XerD [Nitrososphaeraceae archaeon]|nr:site-specific recombinase XerD [Nitrososphaeraceae archaeon]
MKVKQQEEVAIGNNNSKSLRTFVNSINSPRTEETYVNNIKGYIEYHNIKNFDSLLEIDKEKTFEMIEDYITFNRKEKQRSSSRINGIICSIRLFYSVNRYDELNWYILARFKGKERRKMVDDRAYTREEIKKMLEYSDIRMKVAILVMLSSGVRVDGLVSIRLKDLDYNEQYKLYKIRIYSDDLNESYFTFCTPECTQFIKLYLEERKRKNGEVLNPNSPLIRKDFDCFRDLKLSPHSIAERIRRINLASGVQASFQIKEDDDPIEVRRKRHEIMTCHGLRKFFDTVCIDSNMKHIAKEILMGHKQDLGMDRHYYRPTSDKLLNEYLQVVDGLTINDENRLTKQVQELKEKNEDSEYVIKGKLQEKEDQIKKLEESVSFLADKFNAFLATQPGNKILYDDDDGRQPRIVKGIELKPEINHKAIGQVISSSNSNNNKKKK